MTTPLTLGAVQTMPVTLQVFRHIAFISEEVQAVMAL